MAYSRIKTWIPGETLTASALNTEFSGNITNENDLGTKLATEITTRGTLRTEFDAFVTLYNVVDKIWTYQNTAPTGWNIVASTTDALLACKGGSNAYNTTGGQQIGTWTQPNHTHTGPSHTHTGPSHQHTYTTVIAHVHTANRGQPVEGSDTGIVMTTVASGVTATPNQINSTGSASGTTAAAGTGATAAGGTGATGNGASAATYRPLANLGIIIEKS